MAGRRANHRSEAQAHRMPVVVGGSFQLAHPDRGHLHQPAFERSVEGGVPLHPVDEKNAVTLKGITVDVGLDAFRCVAYLYDVDRAHNAATYPYLSDTIFHQHTHLASA